MCLSNIFIIKACQLNFKDRYLGAGRVSYEKKQKQYLKGFGSNKYLPILELLFDNRYTFPQV